MRPRFSACSSLVFAATFAFLSLCPAESAAQTYMNSVWQQLQRAYGIASGEGMSAHNYVMGRIDDGETEDWTFRLEGGRRYLFAGICDSDCEDMDLAISDNYGNSLDSDTQTDAEPIVQIEVSVEGIYELEVDMYECSVEPCYYGVGVFYKSR